MRLIQLHHPVKGRRIAKVEEPSLFLLDERYPSCYALFEEIINNNRPTNEYIADLVTDQQLNYDRVYNGETEWRILPAFDHPGNPLQCMLSGTGLTHKASAENRQQMHEKLSGEDDITDSMEMYLWGEEGGKPGKGNIGVQPEWFFKGNGSALRGLLDPLIVPPYAEDGGEEPEIAGIYCISDKGRPFRIGFCIANEFSDHIMEKKNYLYLAPSKIRTPAIGPELIIENNFQDINGTVSIERKNDILWSKDIKSGEQNMAHSLENLEYHHFKYKQHLIPGMVHVHFYGADAFSFGENIHLQNGDLMIVSFEGFGRSLRNPIEINHNPEELIPVGTLD